MLRRHSQPRNVEGNCWPSSRKATAGAVIDPEKRRKLAQERSEYGAARYQVGHTEETRQRHSDINCGRLPSGD